MREGTLINDRYRVLRLISRRGVNQVHEGVDLETDTPVAIKVSTPTTGYHELLRGLERAVRIGRELDRASSGQIRALDCGEFQDHALFAILDYVEDAKDLSLLVGSFDERLVRFRRAALLVRELHMLDIVHRDLRPGNFLITPSGRIHLSGFTMARVISDRLDDEDVSRTAIALGKPHYYMSPELIAGGDPHPTIDVYAMGVLLFQALCGELPYPGTLDDMIVAHREVEQGYQPPPSPRQIDPGIPPHLDQLCQLAIHVDPHHRLGSIDELLDGLEEEPEPVARPAPQPISGRMRRAPPPQRPRVVTPPNAQRVVPPPHSGEFPIYQEESYDAPSVPTAPAPRPEPRELAPEPIAPEPVEPEPVEPLPARVAGVEDDPVKGILMEVRHTLPAIAGAVALKGQEIKFVYFSAHELISGKVALSFLLEDRRARYAFLEQRVTLDPDQLEGKPTGMASLLMAANAVNLYAPGMRCVVSDDRLRFRREVLLQNRGVLTPEDLQLQVDLLLSGWPQVFAALRDVQGGASWHEALGFLLRLPPSDGERLSIVEEVLKGVDDLELQRLPNDRLAVGSGEDQAVISCLDEEVHVSQLIRSWQAPKREAKALKKGKHARTVEAVLEELNEKNHETFYSLAWDPKRGIVAQAQLAEFNHSLDTLVSFLQLLEGETSQEVFTSLGEGPGAKKKRSWLPWR